ncbi:MAG TPA: glycosyltransferase family 4 protein [Casimicrobiaceae bacterium]
MRIGFVDVTATVSYGGVQTAVWQLARALAARGHEVAVYGGDGTLRPLGENARVAVRTFPFVPRERVLDLGTRFTRIVERWSFARHARREVARADHDWLIVTKPFDFIWPRLLPRASRTRVCFMSGGTDFFAGDRRLAPRIDAMTACSHFNAWQIAARYKRHPAVIYNGVDTARFNPAARSDAVRRSLSRDPDAVLLAFAGRLVGWKGLGVAIDAIAHPALAALPLRLALVGDGPERTKLEERVRQRDAQARVVFHPPVAHDEVPAIYASADIALFPSIGDEAFGIAIAEAMSCGCAVIASHVGGIPEVVGNEGHAGRLVAPGRVDDWVAAIATLVRDASARQALGAAARARIESNFTWDHAAARLLRELESAA